jgi:topoisomerase-4 subunit B
MSEVKYTESEIKSLDWKEHIRLRPGMYIGKLGDGSAADDGVYILLKEVLDNSIDEHVMGFGKVIEIEMGEDYLQVRDYGRGIPLGKVVDCVSKINTGGKYDSKAFKKSVGLNGVGTKAVNALSSRFIVRAIREGKEKRAVFQRGELVDDPKPGKTKERNGTEITFYPDEEIFNTFKFRREFIESQLWNYAFLNAGLKIKFNGKTFVSRNGLRDLLEKKTAKEKLQYPIIHLQADDVELALSHSSSYGEQYYSFVNGQHTTQGGTHLSAFKESIVRTTRDFFGKNYDPRDIRASIVAAISVRVEDPIFESQTKTKLGSNDMGPEGPTVRSFMNEFLRTKLDNYLHRHSEVADALQKRIQQSERERKEIAGVKKMANERAKKASVHNKKLRDCRVHFDHKRRSEEDKKKTTLFITEGDSASGSITKARDVQFQAVFSLRGKPLNCYGLTKKVVYQNEEFNLLQHALNIEDGLEELRYNRVVIATDADVDGAHIRTLLLTFFFRYMRPLITHGKLFVACPPIYRLVHGKKSAYIYPPITSLEAAAKEE